MSTEFVNAISSLPILAGRSICDQSGYVIDSAYQKVSAMSSYALSANVSGVISAVSSNSADWNYDHDTLKTNSAGWDSCYNTVMDKSASWEDTKSAVSANSATWGQGGVDSATVSAIASSYAESAVSSKVDSSALSSYALSSDVSGCIDTVSSNSASWGGASLPITGSVGTDSATYGPTSVEFTRYDTAGEPDIRTASLSPDVLNIMSTVDGNDYYSVNINENGIEFGDPDGYYSVNPSDISTWNSAVETVANNSASWGGGGAQVVTATGSASATAFTGGFPGIATSYLVSSINGSAILPYGYSSLSSNSAKWTSTNSAVSANSANWTSTTSAVSANSAGWTSTNSAVSANSAKWNSTNTTVRTNSANWISVYNTVSSNSASWSGSTGGSVTSPSGTIMVMNGNEIEATNSAVVTASGTGFEELLSPQTQQIGTYIQTLTNDTVPGTGATLRIPLENPVWTDIRVILSGQGGNGSTSASGVIPSGVLTASIPMDGITGNISASAEQWVALVPSQPLTAKKDGDIQVTGVAELAWKSAVDNVTNTVSSNSASWGQGGVDSATVSSIASSYAESAVSSKQDSSAMSAYALSSNVSGVIDTVSSNSASWGQGGVDSATVSAIASSYAESAVSGKMDTSAIDYTRTDDGTQIYASGIGTSTNQFSAKNDSAGAAIIAGTNARVRLWDSAATANIYASSVGPWNAATNLVTAQSANWGGSALALSAGPGVKLEKSGNVLVASTDETVLFETNAVYGSGDCELSESLKNFERIGVLATRGYSAGDTPGGTGPWSIWDTNGISADGQDFHSISPFMFEGYNWKNSVYSANATYTKLTWYRGINKNMGTTNAGTTASSFTGCVGIRKVIGINRTAGV